MRALHGGGEVVEDALPGPAGQASGGGEVLQARTSISLAPMSRCPGRIVLRTRTRLVTSWSMSLSPDMIKTLRLARVPCTRVEGGDDVARFGVFGLGPADAQGAEAPLGVGKRLDRGRAASSAGRCAL